MSFSFVHLRVHSEYSLVDGLVKVKPLIKSVAEAGMPAVAVTDQNNMCSLVKFYRGAMGAGVKPISGVDLWVLGGEDDAQLTRLTLLSMNKQGYRNLTELISRGYTEGQRNGLVTLRREWIAEASEGVIALSGAKEGEIGLALLSNSPVAADELLDYWMGVFPGRFDLELQRTSRVNDEEHLHSAVALGVRKGCPVVATNDVRFIRREDFEAHETRVCIGEGRVLGDPRRAKQYSDCLLYTSPSPRD